MNCRILIGAIFKEKNRYKNHRTTKIHPFWWVYKHIQDIGNDTIGPMRGREAALEAFRRNPGGVRFSDLGRICDHYFGEPRHKVRATGYTAHVAGRPQSEHPE